MAGFTYGVTAALALATAIALHTPIAAAAADPRPPSELQLRTARFVADFVSRLSYLVAEEQLQFRDGKKVVSDFLLVRDARHQKELLTFRDIRLLNGTPIPNREQRLLDLWKQEAATALDRAKQLSATSREHVPVTLNPLLGVALLQQDYLSRFKVDDKDASGRDFPRNTRTLVFQETAKPTLFRSGVFNDQDVPTRGTAWVERDTGRVLQTELQIRVGSSVTKITTKFAVDEGTGFYVPTQMTTAKPDAFATYRNFRRFNVTVAEQLRN